MATPLTLQFGAIANTGQLYQFSRPVGAIRLSCISAVATDGVYFKLMNANAGDSLSYNAGALSPAGNPATPIAATYGFLLAGESVELDYFYGKQAPQPQADPLLNKWTHITFWSGTATAIVSAVAN
jgi:hypothetical protein